MPCSALSSTSDTDIVLQPCVFSVVEPQNESVNRSWWHSQFFFFAVMLKLYLNLLIIFRASLLSGVVPEDWRLARIVQVLKKKKRWDATNYRLISLTSCCKLLEHILADYIINCLNTNNFLLYCWHGFRKSFSTVAQLTSIVHDFAGVLDKTGQVDAIFLHFQKVCDLVSHVHLFHKLIVIGLPTCVT